MTLDILRFYSSFEGRKFYNNKVNILQHNVEYQGIF